uniref:Glucosamine 6-phosphate N-acetyltransferase n=1 Tax=Steinernema glaseri TaxID=37863 RepID=A0A1I8A3X9_9BILA
MRPLRLTDYYNGCVLAVTMIVWQLHCSTLFLQLLADLTTVGDVSFEKFEHQFRAMQSSQPHNYYVIVVEDGRTSEIVAAATLVIELKFIHQAGCRGRVEDVVVLSSRRSLKLGVALNTCLVALAKKLSVYKLSLECKDSLIGFYEKFGYKVDAGNNFLVQRFDSKI